MRIWTAIFWGVLILLPAPAALAQTGDLNRRLLLNYDRLERPDYYGAQKILAGIDQDDSGGGFPGHALLAWSALAEATGRAPKNLKTLLDGLPAKFNARGYLGADLNPEAIDERQLAGHGVLISGLLRAGALTSDTRTLEWTRAMIRELALPLRGRFSQYPRTPADSRATSAAAAGGLTGKVLGGWQLSSDTGCAFIFLEGLVAADRAMPSPELEQVIGEAGEAFFSLNWVALQGQTHAALCAARNLLLYERRHGLRRGWLPKIETFYKLYRERAMTENYASWNWFGRPDSWTEPCGSAQSFMLALELWRATGHEQYLNDAHAIFYNGLGYGQKSHGGFGCDTIAGISSPTLATRDWDETRCGNMGGAVGLAAAAQARAEVRENTLLFPFFADGVFKAAGWRVAEQTGWPYKGEVSVQLDRDASATTALRQVGFFVPAGFLHEKVKLTLGGKPAAGQWTKGFLTVPLPAKGDSFLLELKLEIPLHLEKPVSAATRKDWVTVRYGCLILGTPNGQRLPPVGLADLKEQGDGRFAVKGTELVLEPLCRMPFTGATKSKPWLTQILFVPKNKEAR